MTEHTYSRAKPTDSELDKLRSRLGGKVEPNASGATNDILPGSTASLAARLKQPELSEEQLAAIEHNRANRAAIREATLAAQRKKAKTVKDLPPDPVNGEVDPADAVHEAALDDTPPEQAGMPMGPSPVEVLAEVQRMASAGEPLIDIGDVPADAPTVDELLD
jgi:hypothetical protein